MMIIYNLVQSVGWAPQIPNFQENGSKYNIAQRIGIYRYQAYIGVEEGLRGKKGKIKNKKKKRFYVCRL